MQTKAYDEGSPSDPQPPLLLLPPTLVNIRYHSHDQRTSMTVLAPAAMRGKYLLVNKQGVEPQLVAPWWYGLGRVVNVKDVCRINNACGTCSLPVGSFNYPHAQDQIRFPKSSEVMLRSVMEWQYQASHVSSPSFSALGV